MSLLSRLVPVWHELHPTYAEGLQHVLYRLVATYCCLDVKSPSPFVRSLMSEAHAAQAPGSNRYVSSTVLTVLYKQFY